MNKEYSIYEIIDFLVGSVDVYCETNHDKESYNNLEKLNDVVIYLMRYLYDNAQYYGDYRGSANAIAIKSISITENIKEWCNDIIRYKENGDSNEN